jgi:hypothetical protein
MYLDIDGINMAGAGASDMPLQPAATNRLSRSNCR